MWGWFGGATAASKKKDVTKDAILKLRQQLEMLQKKEKHLEQLVAEQDSIARKLVQTNKNGAMAALKRKKMHENHLTQTQAQIQTVEQQMHTVETANLNFETLKVMQSASNAMKSLHNGMNIDKLDETMDELREQQQLADELGNALSSLGEQQDETELLGELEAMEHQQLDDKMRKAPAAPIPIAAGPQTSKGKEIEEDEETELMKLRAEMAM